MKKLLSLAAMALYFTCLAQVKSNKYSAGNKIENSNFRTGQLSNGLTYYIIRNAEPAGEIEMRLVVKAGGLYSAADQPPYAHIVEHLAFEESKNFPAQGAYKFIERQGLVVGNNINAATPDFYTSYKLSLPAETKLIDTGLLILHDFAGAVAINKDNAIAQAGAVMEEWRGTMGVGTVDFKKLGIIYNNSELDFFRPEYSQQMQNLKKQVTKNHLPLNEFYQKWYRPDLQAVIIVGDIKVDEIMKKLKELFADILMPKIPKSEPPEGIEQRIMGKLSGTDRLRQIEDNNLKTFRIEYILKRKSNVTALRTKSDFKKHVLNELISQLLNNRFNSVPEQYDIPKLMAYASRNNYNTSIDLFNISTEIETADQLPGTLEKIIVETERIKKYGFTDQELAGAKKAFMEQYKRLDKKTSAILAENYINHFVFQIPVFDDKVENKLVTNFVNYTSDKEVNTEIASWLNGAENDIFLSASKAQLDEIPLNKTVSDIISRAKQIQPEPFQKVIAGPLTSIMSQVEIAALASQKMSVSNWNNDTSMKVVKFSNGITVLLKQDTRFKKGPGEEIRFMGHSHGGTSLYNGNDFVNAAVAAEIVGNNGLGIYNKFQLNQLTERGINSAAFIDADAERIFANSSFDEMELMLQLVYLYFTAPRKDSIAYRYWRQTKENEAKFNTDNRRSLSRIESLPGNIPILSVEELKSVNMEDAYRIYGERFANAVDFTFLLMGHFNQDKALSLLARYIGNLPVSDIRDNPVKQNLITLDSISKVIPVSNAGAATVTLRFDNGRYLNYSAKNIVYTKILAKLLHIAIFDRLRTREGGVYSPFASGAGTRVSYNDANYNFTVSFTCAPENIEKLINASKEEFLKLKSGPLDDVAVASAIKSLKSDVNQQMLDDDRSLLLQTMNMYLFKDKNIEFESLLEALDIVTADEVKAATKSMMTAEFLQQTILLPIK